MTRDDLDGCYTADDLLIRQEMQIRQIQRDLIEHHMIQDGLLHAFIDAFVNLVDPGGVL